MFKNFRRVGYSTKEGIAIWYLLPCEKQEEQITLDSCKEYFSDSALRDAFVLTYDGMRRYCGARQKEKKLIFPANVLLESENEEALKKELNQYWNASGSKGDVSKINPEEEKLLTALCGSKRNIEMSRGVICNGVMQVTEGPLKGMESRICKVDRHKRLARLWTRREQLVRYIPAGLEIVEKIV